METLIELEEEYQESFGVGGVNEDQVNKEDNNEKCDSYCKMNHPCLLIKGHKGLHECKVENYKW